MKLIPSSKPKSLQGILASFNKVIEDLKTLQTHNNSTIDTNIKTIDTLKAANTQLATEAEQAKNVEANLSKLIGQQ